MEWLVEHVTTAEQRHDQVRAALGVEAADLPGRRARTPEPIGIGGHRGVVRRRHVVRALGTAPSSVIAVPLSEVHHDIDPPLRQR